MRRFLSSQSAPWGVLDTWLNQGHPLGVFTVLADHARGDGWLAEVKGDHLGVWGLAVVDRVTGEPGDRLRQALDQGKRRQGKGMSGSVQPPQVWPSADYAPHRVRVVTDERDNGSSHTWMEDHQAEMRPVPRYAQDRVGQGRWVQLHRFGGPIGTLWTDDAQALGFIPEPGASVSLLVNSIRSAYAQGTPTAWVFDDHAAWAAQDHWAGPVQTGDLATLGSGRSAAAVPPQAQ
jgi:hypothetical protein